MALRSDFRIVPVNTSDIETILRWRNLDHVRKYMYTDHVISKEEHKRWFESINNGDKSVDYKLFNFQDRPVGLIGFTKIDRVSRRCCWSFYLGEDNVPIKTGPAMEYFAIEYAFEDIKVRKLCCEVLAQNERVVKLHKKFGFQQEGYFVQHVWKGEKYEDVVALATFDSDWILKKKTVASLLFK